MDWQRPIVAWLLVTARNLASNRFRRQRHGLPPMTSSGFRPPNACRMSSQRTRTASSEGCLERTALIMTAVEGWSYGEAAEVLQTTDEALRAAVSRARDELEAA